MADWKLTGVAFAVFVLVGLTLRAVMPDRIAFVGPWIGGAVAAILVFSVRRLAKRG
jgi:uncharacterized protein (DUF697 family)